MGCSDSRNRGDLWELKTISNNFILPSSMDSITLQQPSLDMMPTLSIINYGEIRGYVDIIVSDKFVTSSSNILVLKEVSSVKIQRKKDLHLHGAKKRILLRVNYQAF